MVDPHVCFSDRGKGVVVALRSLHRAQKSLSVFTLHLQCQSVSVSSYAVSVEHLVLVDHLP